MPAPRFAVGDRVRVRDDASFARGEQGVISSIDYETDDDDPNFSEYMVLFDYPVPNPDYSPDNCDWEDPMWVDSYFAEGELEFAVRFPVKRVSGFGKFIKRVEEE